MPSSRRILLHFLACNLGAVALPGAEAATGNDNFSSRSVVTGAELATTVDTALATREMDEPLHAGRSGNKSVWWSWTAPSTGIVSLDTIGSSFDTVLAVYTGGSVGSLTRVADNDNYGNREYNRGASKLSFRAVAGTAYQVALDGASGDGGVAQLNLSYAYAFTTLAGSLKIAGTDDGIGAGAGFTLPVAIVVDHLGQLYVADTHNDSIRKLLPNGRVTTLAGESRVPGSVDGMGRMARFDKPEGIAVDPDGNLFVADTGNHTIRKITPDGRVTTIAGMSGRPGMDDGVGGQARFSRPTGLAIDRSGNVFVADTQSQRIRKITSGGLVSTIGGHRTDTLLVEGSAADVRFEAPRAIAVDAHGAVYVADRYSMIRKIVDGMVTIVVGGAFRADGMGRNAGFNLPCGLTFDAAGNLYVADTGYHAIRKITPAGMVSTVGGELGQQGWSDGAGAEAHFGYFQSFGLAASFGVSGVAIDSNGILYVADTANCAIRRGVIALAPEIQTQPFDLAVPVGATLSLTVGVRSTLPLTYQWFRNGSPLAGATEAILANASADPSWSGSYTVTVSNLVGAVTSRVATLSVSQTPQRRTALRNLSIRAPAGQGEQSLILGFGVSGGNADLLIRAIGPTLQALGVQGTVSDPLLNLYGHQQLLATNDNWGQWHDLNSLEEALRITNAFGLPVGSLDASLRSTLQPGSYTAIIGSPPDSPGVALGEVYDTGAGEERARLVNLSARATVLNSSDRVIAGFVTAGPGAKVLLIRAIGPTLAEFGIGGALRNPKIELFSGSTLLYENERWSGQNSLSNAFTKVGAFPLAVSSDDAALLVTLPPGPYTVQVAGLYGTRGVCLLEIYELP